MTTVSEAPEMALAFLREVGAKGGTSADLAALGGRSVCWAKHGLNAIFGKGLCVRFYIGGRYVWFYKEHEADGLLAHKSHKAKSAQARLERRRKWNLMNPRSKRQKPKPEAVIDPPIIKRTISANEAEPVETTAPRWVFEVAA